MVAQSVMCGVAAASRPVLCSFLAHGSLKVLRPNKCLVLLMRAYRGSSVAVCFVLVDAYDVYLELFLVEPIIKSGLSGRPKLSGSDSRLNCGSSFCGKRWYGLVETSEEWLLLVVSVTVLS